MALRSRRCGSRPPVRILARSRARVEGSDYAVARKHDRLGFVDPRFNTIPFSRNQNTLLLEPRRSGGVSEREGKERTRVKGKHYFISNQTTKLKEGL